MKPLLALIAVHVLSLSIHSIALELPPGWHQVDGLPLSVERYPILWDKILSKDGKEVALGYRKPVGEGPFPVMLFFLGGGQTVKDEAINSFLQSATPTRFLQKGYMVVASTRREFQWMKTNDPTSYSGGMVHDGVAAVEKARTLLGADPKSIVLYGGSLGGSLAIETAAQVSVAALVVGEPSSATWMLELEERVSNFSKHDVFPSYYTKEVKSFVRSVLGRIDCPFLLLHGDPTGFKQSWLQIMRELTELGKRGKSIGYVGYKHGFYFGWGERQMTGRELDEVIEDTHTFILPYLNTMPKPLPPLSSP